MAWALEAVEAAAVARIADFNPQDFSNLIWAFAKLRHTPGPAFQLQFEEAALAKLHEFPTQSLANTAYAYAALDLPGARNMLPFVHINLAERLDQCGPSELVMVLWAGPSTLFSLTLSTSITSVG